MCILTPRERNPEEKDEEVDPGTDVGYLASEGDRPQGDDKEQVGNVGLDALPMKNLALTRAGGKKLTTDVQKCLAIKITHSQVS